MNTVIFDIESTGLDINKDRIVEIALMVIDKDLNVLNKESFLINPEMPIPKEASDIHGITDKMVKSSPTFKNLCSTLKPYFENNAITGYNILRFDLPLLYAEFDRAGWTVNFNKTIYDVYTIETKVKSNKLGDVYKRYTGKEIEDSHRAAGDVDATYVVLKHQMPSIKSSGEKVTVLSGTNDLVDFTRHLCKNEEGVVCFNFGKNKGKPVVSDRAYCSWLLSSDFPKQTKDILLRLLK